MFLICSWIVGVGHVEDVCGRSRGAGVDYAVCRDDRGLGATDSPALMRLAARQVRRAGEKPDGGREERVPRGLRKAKASPLRWRVGAQERPTIAPTAMQRAR